MQPFSRAGLALLAALALPLAARAQPAPGPDHHGMMDVIPLLGLTATQQAQIHTMFDTRRGAMHAAMAQEHALHRQFAQALLSGASSTTLAGLQQQSEALRARMDAEHLQMLLQMRSLLTPAQLAAAQTKLTRLAALHAQERALMHPSAP